MRNRLTATALTALLASALLLPGCVSKLTKRDSKAQIRFRCDEVVNGGVLLTVDVIHGVEADARRIRELGEKWFYDPARSGLGDRLRTITVSTSDPSAGRCDTVVDVRAPKADEFLIIVADYRLGEGGARLLTLPKKSWKGKTLQIGLHDRDLTNDTR